MNPKATGIQPATKVMLASGDPERWRTLLTDLSDTNKGIDLVARASTLEEVYSHSRMAEIEVALVCEDFGSEPLEALQVVRRIRMVTPGAKVILCSYRENRMVTLAAFRSGVRGIFHLADLSRHGLGFCVGRVHAGEVWANYTEVGWIIDALLRQTLPRIEEPEIRVSHFSILKINLLLTV